MSFLSKDATGKRFAGQRTRLVYFQQNACFGATEKNYLKALATSMSEFQREVWLVYPDHPALEPFREVEDWGVKIATYSVSSSSSLHALYEMFSLFQRLQPLLVHFNDPCVHGIIVAKLAQVPLLVMTHHTPELNRRYNWKGKLLERVAFRALTHTVFNSERNRNTAAQQDGLPLTKSTAMFFGLSPNDFRVNLTNQRALVRQELDIPAEHRVVINVARLSEQKGQNCLIQAAQLVTQSRTNVTFIVAGDGEMKADLSRQIRLAGLSNCFRLLGHRCDIPRLLAASDVFALSSEFEGLPYALLEAMASRLPVVATTVGGAPDAVMDGMTGRLIPPRDPAKLAEAILWMLDHPQQAHAMGLEGRRRFESDFTLERMVKQTECLYRKLLSTESLRRADVQS